MATGGVGHQKNQFILGDCMEVMLSYPDNYFDLAIVDPPYGISINMNMGRRKGAEKVFVDKKWDESPPDEEYFSELFRVSKNQIIWGGNYFPLPLTKSWIFWDKDVPLGVSFADGELAWTSFDKTLVKANLPYSGFHGLDDGGKVHPTQKPIALYRWLFEAYASHTDKILDTFLGSGSSAIAAHYYGVEEFVGIEIDEEYFNLAQDRFVKRTRQLKLF